MVSSKHKVQCCNRLLLKEPICLEIATLANLHHQPLQTGGGCGWGGGADVNNLQNSAGGVCNHASAVFPLKLGK